MSATQSLLGTLTDAHGRQVAVSGQVTVYDLPTASLAVVSPTGPVCAGDEVTVSVTGTTDPDAGPGTAALTVDGVPVPASPDGLFRFTAA